MPSQIASIYVCIAVLKHRVFIHRLWLLSCGGTCYEVLIAGVLCLEVTVRIRMRLNCTCGDEEAVNELGKSQHTEITKDCISDYSSHLEGYPHNLLASFPFNLF